MSATTHLTLPYIAAAQAQKHVTHNEALRALDAVVQLAVLNQDQTSPPVSPAEGDRHIIAAGASGDWAGRDGQIGAYQDGAWAYYTAQEGWLAWDESTLGLFVFSGGVWAVASIADASNLGALAGVNTTADTTNRLAVKSDAVLLSHDDVTPGSGNCQVVVNKSAAANTASFLFQDGYSGRAEIGLTGDDSFHFKVSADGVSFVDAITIASDGDVEVGDKLEAKRVFLYNEAYDTYFYTRKDDTGGSCNWTAANGADGLVGQFLLNFAAQSYGAWEFYVPAGNDTSRFGCVVIGSEGVEIVNVGLVVGSPTGGSQGAGTINAQAIYDDNALLSCYVFDLELDGDIDDAKWDALVPDRWVQPASDSPDGPRAPAYLVERRHEPMRRFSARAGTDYDPLTLEGYARHWREKRHLTSLPNEASYDPEQGLSSGDWIQRLVETAEIQAILIEQLHGRIKALEAG